MNYFTLGPAGSTVCAQSFQDIQQAACDAGIPLAPEKIESAAMRLIFLGIKLDSSAMTARLPSDKLVDLLSLVHVWITKTYCKH